MKTLTDRRTFLRGAGAALALPWLASGAEGAAPWRLFCLANHLGYWPDGFLPQEAGREYATSQTLKFIDAHRNDSIVFSHLDHGIKGWHSAVPKATPTSFTSGKSICRN